MEILGDLLNNLPKFVFFTGKGGVGKTSMASYVSVTLAERGKRVLLVSTDPASNLDEVLQTKLTDLPKEITGIDNLSAMNLDPQLAAERYREEVVGRFRDSLPESVISSIEEQLSGACTVEIAAFDEFVKYLSDPKVSLEYNHIIFDTAPSGHTLRLLSLPSAWNNFIDANKIGVSCLGPLSGLQNQQKQYEGAVKTLADSKKTVVILVARANLLDLNEANRTYKELTNLNINNHRLIINGIFDKVNSDDEFAKTLAAENLFSIENMPEPISKIPNYKVPLIPWNLVGIEALQRLNKNLISNELKIDADDLKSNNNLELNNDTLKDFVENLSLKKKGLVLVMGKGGVGKTTLATSIAIALGSKGHKVVLTTTDPAAHLDLIFDSQRRYDNITVSKIDPEEATSKYRREVIESFGENLDDGGRAVLQEDLNSPCTTEIAVFKEFAKNVESAKNDFIILDTAPTGHTLLLLDSAGIYQKEAMRKDNSSPEILNLLDNLRNPDFTSVLIVSLPEPTPIHEAKSLQDDLIRAGIQPKLWIINKCLSSLKISDRDLVSRASLEKRYIYEVKEKYSKIFACIPFVADAKERLNEIVTYIL